MNFLDKIREPQKSITLKTQCIATAGILLFGICMGVFSKFLDYRQGELPALLQIIDNAFDLHNFLGRFSIWVMIALCISVYSNSPIRAAINVFIFFAGMVASYYLYSNYVAGFFPRSYAMVWAGFTALSPLLAFICWYAKGTGKFAFMLSATILAVIFNMTFAYGIGYFHVRSILELVTLICSIVILRRDHFKNTISMFALSCCIAIVLNLILPFCFE
ncbi:MAG: hypothetical protein LUB63_08025 [Oscillospiraceae bacterium]|nr:hypothetical protein [Oscillospiraceae bacterium]